MYLVDTNIWLEVLLRQERLDEARQFLTMVEARFLAITDFILYSIGIHLTRRKKYADFENFLSDILEGTGLQQIVLDTSELKQMLPVCRRFALDFDDAYQYAAAEKYNLTIVSFDPDFDRTERGRRTPGQINMARQTESGE